MGCNIRSIDGGIVFESLGSLKALLNSRGKEMLKGRTVDFRRDRSWVGEAGCQRSALSWRGAKTMSLLLVALLSVWPSLFAQNLVMRQREEQVEPVRRKSQVRPVDPCRCSVGCDIEKGEG